MTSHRFKKAPTLTAFLLTLSLATPPAIWAQVGDPNIETPRVRKQTMRSQRQGEKKGRERRCFFKSV